MRLRLPDRRPFDYQTVRSNAVWPDHRLRTMVTAAMVAWMGAETVVDPATGDGSIIRQADKLRPFKNVLLGDISAPNARTLKLLWPEANVAVGPAEDTLLAVEPSDLIVLTEILEHVEDPVGLLRLARSKGKLLVASSPLFEAEKPAVDGMEAASGYRVDSNPEHLWQFDADGYREMLAEAGWEPISYIPLYFQTMYDFQLWAAQ